MALITSGNFSGINIFRRGNDSYTQTPNLLMNALNLFNKSEQYISISGNESLLLKTTPQLNAVIYRRAKMVANGRWIHYDRNDNVIEKSPLVKFLNRPNPFQTGKEWMIQNSIQKSIYGNSLAYILKGTKLAPIPSALWNLSPQYITIDRTGQIFNQTDENKIIEQYKLNFDQTTGLSQITFEPYEILHMNRQDIDDPIMGASPLHALKMPISNIRASYGYRNVIMEEKGAIGILSNQSKGSSGALPLTEPERKAIDKAYSRNHGISERQRKIIMTNASLVWQPMSYPTKEMMLFEEVTDDFRIIIDFYGLDESLFAVGGASGGVTYENKKEAKKGVYQDTIIPEGEDFALGMTTKLGLEEKGERLELDYSHVAVLQEDKKKEAEVVLTKSKAAKNLKDTGIYSDKEIKEAVDL